MYGIVNKAIQGLVTENFGEEAWLKIKAKSGVNRDEFLNNDSYPDSETFSLAIAAAEVLNITLEQVLIAFGEYWILKTGLHHYGALMKSGGDNFKDFLINLPNFHSRVMLMYPNITPPEFLINELENEQLEVHYYSERSGLTYFVWGLLQGMGKMFNNTLEIELTQQKNNENDHDIFIVKIVVA